MRPVLAALTLTLIATTAGAQAPAPAAAPPPCTAAEYAQMDFWVGRWDVFNGKDHTGRSLIEKTVDGCGVRETFTGDDDYRGTSLSWYDLTDRRWRQTYLNNQGSSSRFEGALSGTDMVMVAHKQTVKGYPFQARMTLAPRSDGTVAQQEEISIDGGKTWKIGYAFVYRRAN